MGVERRSVVLSELDRVNCAYHEAGHAVVAALLPDADPLHKVTIIPRGRAMGVTMQLPEADRHTYTKAYLDTQIAVLMGGRVAEELFMNHMTSGASNDIERATDIAQHMVCEWGMSALGMRAFRKPGNKFDPDKPHAMSEATGAPCRRGNREDPRTTATTARTICSIATGPPSRRSPRRSSTRKRSKPTKSKRCSLRPTRSRKRRRPPTARGACFLRRSPVHTSAIRASFPPRPDVRCCGGERPLERAQPPIDFSDGCADLLFSDRMRRRTGLTRQLRFGKLQRFHFAQPSRDRSTAATIGAPTTIRLALFHLLLDPRFGVDQALSGISHRPRIQDTGEMQRQNDWMISQSRSQIAEAGLLEYIIDRGKRAGVLDLFHGAVADWFQASFRGADAAAGAGLAGHRARRIDADSGAHRQRQDARRLSVGDQPNHVPTPRRRATRAPSASAAASSTSRR